MSWPGRIRSKLWISPWLEIFLRSSSILNLEDNIVYHCFPMYISSMCLWRGVPCVNLCKEFSKHRNNVD